MKKLATTPHSNGLELFAKRYSSGLCGAKEGVRVAVPAAAPTPFRSGNYVGPYKLGKSHRCHFEQIRQQMAKGITVHFLQTSRSALDELDDRKLFELATQSRQEQGSYTQPIAERLDQILVIRTTRLVQSVRATGDDCAALTNLISRLAHDAVAAELEALPARYATRWQMLKDMLLASQRLREHQRAAERAVSLTPRDGLWRAIATRLCEAGAAGAPMAEVAELIRQWPDSPASKGGISQLISQMRAAGWVESLARGRTRQLFTGPNVPSELLLSAAPTEKSQEMPTGQLTEPSPQSVARSVVCYNQGAFLGYYFLAHEKHAELRKGMEEASGPRSNHPTKTPARVTVLQARQELDRFLQNGLRQAAVASFRELQTHFDGRSSIAPRICLKVSSLPPGQSPLVTPVIRDSEVRYQSRAAAGENTGFDHVMQTGRPFLCNDLAELALHGEYVNPRLNPERAQALARRFGGEPTHSGSGISLADWRSCWADSDVPGADPRSFYRSTLIVPLTLRYSQIDPLFAKRLGEKLPELNPPAGWDRAVLGFLCLDHVRPNYFKHQVDTDIGYVLADMLSLYMFTRLSLTTLSVNYQDARRLRHQVASAVDNVRNRKVLQARLPAKASGRGASSAVAVVHDRAPAVVE